MPTADVCCPLWSGEGLGLYVDLGTAERPPDIGGSHSGKFATHADGANPVDGAGGAFEFGRGVGFC